MVWKLEPYREGAPAGFLVPLAQFPFVQLRRADPKGDDQCGAFTARMMKTRTMEVVKSLFSCKAAFDTGNLWEVP
jgi:hypothetical protein